MTDWKNNDLVSNLNEIQLNAVAPYLQIHHFTSNEMIIREGEEGDKVYLIEKGQVNIYKDGILLASKKEGDYFGAMALLDDSKRSANIQATEDTQLKSIDKEAIHRLSYEAEDSIFFKILLKQVKTQQAALRNMNVATIRETKQKLLEAEKRISFGSFFLLTLGVLLFYVFVLGLFLEWQEVKQERLYMVGVTLMMITILGISCYQYVKRSDYPPSFFGLSTKNWRRHIRESLVWTLGFVLFITTAKWIMIQVLPSFQGKPLIDINDVVHFDLWIAILVYVVYCLFCPAQEFITRGVYQTGLEQFFEGKNATLYAIILSNILFSSFHLYFNLSFALITLVPGIFWGFLYARQKTLVGVSLSHAIIGVYGAFLGFH